MAEVKLVLQYTMKKGSILTFFFMLQKSYDSLIAVEFDMRCNMRSIRNHTSLAGALCLQSTD